MQAANDNFANGNVQYEAEVYDSDHKLSCQFKYGEISVLMTQYLSNQKVGACTRRIRSPADNNSRNELIIYGNAHSLHTSQLECFFVRLPASVECARSAMPCVCISLCG